MVAGQSVDFNRWRSIRGHSITGSQSERGQSGGQEQLPQKGDLAEFTFLTVRIMYQLTILSSWLMIFEKYVGIYLEDKVSKVWRIGNY